MYKDRNLKEQIEYIDFGIVEAGTSKEIIIYLYNDTRAVLTNLEFVKPNMAEPNSLVVAKMPKTIQPGKIEELIIRWSPSMNFKQALEVPIIIKGDEVYLAEKHLTR